MAERISDNPQLITSGFFAQGLPEHLMETWTRKKMILETNQVRKTSAVLVMKNTRSCMPSFNYNTHPLLIIRSSFRIEIILSLNLAMTWKKLCIHSYVKRLFLGCNPYSDRNMT